MRIKKDNVERIVSDEAGRKMVEAGIAKEVKEQKKKAPKEEPKEEPKEQS